MFLLKLSKVKFNKVTERINDYFKSPFGFIKAFAGCTCAGRFCRFSPDRKGPCAILKCCYKSGGGVDPRRLVSVFLPLLAGRIAHHQAAVAEFYLEHAALAAEFVFPDGIEAEAQRIAVLVDGVGMKLAVLQEDLVDDEIGVLGMLVLSAEAFPLRPVGVLERDILDGSYRLRPELCRRPRKRAR